VVLTPGMKQSHRLGLAVQLLYSITFQLLPLHSFWPIQIIVYKPRDYNNSCSYYVHTTTPYLPPEFPSICLLESQIGETEKCSQSAIVHRPVNGVSYGILRTYNSYTLYYAV
jgi:hypothetical protein